MIKINNVDIEYADTGWLNCYTNFGLFSFACPKDKAEYLSKFLALPRGKCNTIFLDHVTAFVFETIDENNINAFLDAPQFRLILALSPNDLELLSKELSGSK